MADAEQREQSDTTERELKTAPKPKSTRAPGKSGTSGTSQRAPSARKTTGTAKANGATKAPSAPKANGTAKSSGAPKANGSSTPKAARQTEHVQGEEHMSNSDDGMDPNNTQSATEHTQPATTNTPSGPHMVMCAKLGRELPGLARPPMPGEMGQRIYDQISREAWEMWQEHSRLLINHYGLNLADPDARQIMRQQMEEFFFGKDARMPEGWVPESAGAKGKGAVASRK